jgi:HK97 family phage major capsid protein
MVSQTALTIAGYSKISKQALNDQQELTRAIDVTLRRSIAKALDSELNSGAWGGLLTLATAYTSLVYDGLADAASEAVATMQEAGFVPDTVVMRPADWLAITTAKATGSGEYLSGAYLAPLPELLRGMKVVLSPTVTAGKVLVVDSSQIELLVVEDLNVEIGTDADDFTKNVRTILGELRVVPTFRAVGAARLITPA